MAIGQGYSNQKKKGKAQFKTVHSSGSSSYAEAVVQKSLYAVTGLETTITAVQEILGATGQVEFWKLTIAGHSAQVGGVVRMYLGSSIPNFEYEIISIVDANNLLVLPVSETLPIAGTDTASIYGWVSAISDPQGNAQVSVAPSSLSFKLDGSTINVSKNTAVPNNSVPLPTENRIAQASLISIDDKFTILNNKEFATTVRQDIGNASLLSINGQVTAINAKDLSTGARQDVGNTSLSSIDGKLTTLNATDFATSAKQDTSNTSLSSIDGKLTTLNAKDFSTSALQTTGNTSLSSIDGKLTGLATTAKQDTGNTSLSSIDGKLTGVATTALQTTGNTSLSSIDGKLTGVATAANQASLNALFPASIGTKASAESLSVVLASDQVTIPVIPVTTSGTITQTRKAVGITAVRATVAGTAPSAIRKRLLIKPSKNNTGAIYLGSSTVTIASGLEIIGPDRLEFLLDSADYFLISDTAGQAVDILEVF